MARAAHSPAAVLAFEPLHPNCQTAVDPCIFPSFFRLSRIFLGSSFQFAALKVFFDLPDRIAARRPTTYNSAERHTYIGKGIFIISIDHLLNHDESAAWRAVPGARRDLARTPYT